MAAVTKAATVGTTKARRTSLNMVSSLDSWNSPLAAVVSYNHGIVGQVTLLV
jgi:hypothetical protein